LAYCEADSKRPWNDRNRGPISAEVTPEAVRFTFSLMSRRWLPFLLLLCAAPLHAQSSDVTVLVTNYRKVPLIDDTRAGLNAMSAVVIRCTRRTRTLGHQWLRYRVQEDGAVLDVESEFSTMSPAQRRCILRGAGGVRYPVGATAVVRVQWEVAPSDVLVRHRQRKQELRFDFAVDGPAPARRFFDERRTAVESCIDAISGIEVVYEVFEVNLGAAPTVAEPGEPRTVVHNRFRGPDRVAEVGRCLQTVLASDARRGTLRVLVNADLEGGLL